MQYGRRCVVMVEPGNVFQARFHFFERGVFHFLTSEGERKDVGVGELMWLMEYRVPGEVDMEYDPALHGWPPNAGM